MNLPYTYVIVKHSSRSRHLSYDGQKPCPQCIRYSNTPLDSIHADFADSKGEGKDGIEPYSFSISVFGMSH